MGLRDSGSGFGFRDLVRGFRAFSLEFWRHVCVVSKTRVRFGTVIELEPVAKRGPIVLRTAHTKP